MSNLSSLATFSRLLLLCTLCLGERLQYHQQGLRDAPSHVSYRFGFVADDRDNPQTRHEVSYEPGYVTGEYSFIDANNKLQHVRYTAHPEDGFRIVNQWEQDAATATKAENAANTNAKSDGSREERDD